MTSAMSLSPGHIPLLKEAFQVSQLNKPNRDPQKGRRSPRDQQHMLLLHSQPCCNMSPRALHVPPAVTMLGQPQCPPGCLPHPAAGSGYLCPGWCTRAMRGGAGPGPVPHITAAPLANSCPQRHQFFPHSPLSPGLITLPDLHFLWLEKVCQLQPPAPFLRLSFCQ